MCVGLLDDPSTLQAQLAHLKAQHIERKIPDEYFEVSAISLVCFSFSPLSFSLGFSLSI